jgi:hypothetical protein
MEIKKQNVKQPFPICVNRDPGSNINSTIFVSSKHIAPSTSTEHGRRSDRKELCWKHWSPICVSRGCDSNITASIPADEKHFWPRTSTERGRQIDPIDDSKQLSSR